MNNIEQQTTKTKEQQKMRKTPGFTKIKTRALLAGLALGCIGLASTASAQTNAAPMASTNTPPPP
jgi:hypothetical protein